jgi:hypothetical protein
MRQAGNNLTGAPVTFSNPRDAFAGRQGDMVRLAKADGICTSQVRLMQLNAAAFAHHAPMAAASPDQSNKSRELVSTF